MTDSKFLRGASLCVLVTLATQRCSRATDWPQWLGPDRNGVSSETVSPWTDKPPVLWTHEMGSGFNSPILAEGMFIVHAAVNGKDEEQVVAFDAVTGEEKWRDVYGRSPYQSELGAGPRATPSAANGRLYTMGITGVMSCYDVKTGQRLWQTNPYDDLKANRPNFGVCSSPLVVDQRIILPVGGEGSGIVAFDAETGKVAWKSFDEPAASASPVLITRGEGADRKSEVVVQTTLRLVGLDPKDASIRWEHPLVFQPNGVSPTPLSVNGILVCSTQDNGTLALRLPTGSESSPEIAWWNQDFASYFSTGTVDEQGHVYVITNGLNPLPRTDLRCMDAATGDEVWRKDGLGYFHVGVIHLADGKLLLLDDSGQLVLAEQGPDGYKELCKTKVCGGTFCNPLLVDGRVYVRDKGQVACLDLRPKPEQQATTN